MVWDIGCGSSSWGGVDTNTGWPEHGSSHTIRATNTPRCFSQPMPVPGWLRCLRCAVQYCSCQVAVEQLKGTAHPLLQPVAHDLIASPPMPSIFLQPCHDGRLQQGLK